MKRRVSDRSYLRAVHSLMRERCEDPRVGAYARYGAKGISVCEEWKDFEMFYEWAISSGFQRGLEIDRRDGTKGYCPENCRWANSAQQNANIRFRIGRSGYRGVGSSARSRKWMAQVSRDGKKVYLGHFDTKLAAAIAYDAAAFKLYGEFAVLNFPERYRGKAPDEVPMPSRLERGKRKTTAEHSRDVLLEENVSSIEICDVALLDKIVDRINSPRLKRHSRTESRRQVFESLQTSSLFSKELLPSNKCAPGVRRFTLRERLAAELIEVTTD
jgi:hypothetical protein